MKQRRSNRDHKADKWSHSIWGKEVKATLATENVYAAIIVLEARKQSVQHEV